VGATCETIKDIKYRGEKKAITIFMICWCIPQPEQALWKKKQEYSSQVRKWRSQS